MTPYRINLALRSIAVVLIAATPVVCAIGYFSPLDSADDYATRTVAALKPLGRAATTAVSVDSFGPMIDRPLRPSLGEAADGPSTVAADATPSAVSPKQLQLVGTIGDTIAMLKGPDDTIALVEVGDDVEGADVVAIRDQQVELRLNGRLIRLEKITPKADGGEITIR